MAGKRRTVKVIKRVKPKKIIQEVRDQARGKVRSDGLLTCVVCGKTIKKTVAYGIIPSDAKVDYERYYHERKCGIGTENWHRFHPSELSGLMLKYSGN